MYVLAFFFFFDSYVPGLEKLFWSVSNFRILCLIPIQAAVSVLLAVSVLYVENKNKIYITESSKIQQFNTYQIAFFMRNQGHKNNN